MKTGIKVPVAVIVMIVLCVFFLQCWAFFMKKKKILVWDDHTYVHDLLNLV